VSLRFAPILLVATLLAAGCGAGRTGSSAPQADALRGIPAHALAVVQIDLDHGSTAWRAAEAVGARFPHWNRLVAQVHRSLDAPSGGMRYDRDIAPWLGSSAAIAVTGVDVTDAAHPVDVVASVDVTDTAKLEAELRAHQGRRIADYHGAAQYLDTKGNEYAAVSGHTLLVANTLASLHAGEDALRGAAPRLASDRTFRSAMARLPKDSLVTAYADGRRLGQFLTLATLAPTFPPSEQAQLRSLAGTLQTSGSFTASLGADAGGVRLTMNATPPPGGSLPASLARPDGAPALIDEVPANAFAYLGARGGGASPGAPPAGLPGNAASLHAFAQVTGLSVKRDIVPLVNGDFAAYAAPGMPLSVAVLLQPRRPAAAASAMYRIVAAARRLSPGLRVSRLRGGQGQVLPIGPGVNATWRRIGGLIALSNDPAAGSTPPAALRASSAWRSFAAQAHIPGQVGFLGYVNVHQLLQALEPVPDPDASRVGGFAMWSTTGRSGAHFDAYLQVLR
jgi:Protein of unknown function (DUF3352)